MKILVTGRFEQDYNRVRILLKGLRKHGIDLIEYPYEKRNLQTKKELKAIVEDCDIVFLPSFTHLDVPFIKKSISRPLVFDPLISRYLTKVFDRKAVWKYSPRAYKNYLKDKKAFESADLILADTQAHKKYYIETFNINPEKINVVPVGVNTGDFFPQEENETAKDTVNIGFYGSFIPLHGIDKILLSANNLKNRSDIRFSIYGNGELYVKMKAMRDKLSLSNVDLIGWIDYYHLNDAINQMDICLGIFGESLKADLVIPNKIYHYSACRKPVITKDTPGIKEIFKSGENIILSSNDPDKITEKIIFLVNNNDVRKRIGLNAYELIYKEYNEMKTTEYLIDCFKKVLSS